MRFTILDDDRNSDLLIFNPEIAKEMNIPINEDVHLHFGLRSIELKTAVSVDLKKEEISVPHEALIQLSIPLFNCYEIIVKEKGLFLGPFIGILLKTRKKNLDRLRIYSKHYQQLGGVLVAFRSKGMDKYNQMIKGFIYNPETEQWEKDVFPYPSSIYRRKGLRWDHYLYFLYGKRIINQRGFNKWMVYERLETIQGLKEHFPATTLYRNSDDIFSFLKQYTKIYIKPTGGQEGKGIIKISQEKDSFVVQRRIEKNKVTTDRLTSAELLSFLEENLVKNKYIIQHGIELITYRNQLIDFRVIVVKNERGKWQDFGMIGKYGRRNSIVSNLSTGGFAEMGEVTLKKILELTDEEAEKLRLNVSQLAIKVAKGMEKAFGVAYGDLGLDIGVSTDKKVWIIEVNSLGDHTIAVHAGNAELYHQVNRAILLYAKHVSGFGK